MLFFGMVMIGAGMPRAATPADLFLADEPEVYAAIDKLSASGYLPGFLANTRPYTLQSVREAAGAAMASAPQGIDAALARWLSWYTGPSQAARLSLAGGHADSASAPWNRDGIPVPGGWNGEVSFFAREEKTPFFSGQLRAASFFGEEGEDGNRLLEASLEFGTPYLSIQAGKITAWYGPGRRGALLFTNNAQPFPGIRIHNPLPIRPGGRLSFLGSFQYDFFLARMEDKALHPHSLLSGTRLALSPAPWIEFGLSRVLHYGGDDRDNGISEFLDTYFGDNEPSDRSNTLGAWDITLTLPFPAQPVRLYMERGAEDSSHWGRIFLPWDDRFANLFGIYLPRILSLDRLDLRAEYADTWSGETRGDNWYGHSAYPHTYRGEILGHPMGGGARNWFAQARYWFLPTAWGTLSWEQVLRNAGPTAGERRTLWSAGLCGWLTEKWRAEATAVLDRASNRFGLPGPTGTDFSARLSVSYQVTTLTPWIVGGP
ncbi:MAG: hypothetical protein Kow00128_16080 [Deltaproteobacteria bacterium]